MIYVAIFTYNSNVQGGVKMTGMGAMSGKSNMPSNCSMKSTMHKEASTIQAQKSGESQIKNQTSQQIKVSNEILGSKVDMKI